MEYKINEHITLRLEKDSTIIYVNNEEFLHCKYLVFHIPKDQIELYDEADSIDDVLKIYENQELTNHELSISPEEEFWAHCSNLQAWVENNYDTRILHSNIAFPLLKKLVDSGIHEAEYIFKEEIAKRLLSKNETVIRFLLKQNYLKYLNKEELLTTINEVINGDLKNFKMNLLCTFLNKLKQIPPNADTIDCIKMLKMKINWKFQENFWSLRDLDNLNIEELQTLLETLNSFTLKSIDLLCPILTAIYDAGVHKAKEVLKKEIVKRFQTKKYKDLIYIIEWEYLRYFSETEIKDLFKRLNNPQYYNFYQLIETFKKRTSEYKFDKKFNEESQLIRINLSSMKLSDIPRQIFVFLQLEELILRENNLQNLPEEIKILKHLKKLDLGINKFNIFPEQICELPNLEELYLNGNKIKIIPDSISKLTHLRILHLRDNFIQEIPETISHLKNLKNLILSLNQLKTLPDFLLNMPSLKFIEVIDNPKLKVNDNLLNKLKGKEISILIRQPFPK